MTTASEIRRPANAADVDRNIAMLGYGLLFFAIFFAGAPALIAVAIAYARRRDVNCTVASHHRFQIYIFWVGFALTLLMALSGLAALLSIIGDLLGVVSQVRWNGWDTVQTTSLHVGRPFFIFATAAAGLGVVTGLWLMVTAGYGFIRLAYSHAIPQTAR
ncbi:hypothetical protein [Phenylobacterium montanum]|uniref:Uncharacterized protein n=1 Tax=Phenylobacterium montanum TaxID=2823693 RepID=A0A975IVH6_9CAUL|nr:hypothetical protein [Caulobacter sp. S6]QUD89012.1 hypothetical protein KCG34_03755 [Caulobacter sp. S6]